MRAQCKDSPLASKFPIIPKGVLWVVVGQWRVGTVGWNYGELWGIMGFMGIYVRFSGDASVVLFLFVLIPANMSDSDFHAFNNVVYVRLSYLYKPPGSTSRSWVLSGTCIGVYLPFPLSST